MEVIGGREEEDEVLYRSGEQRTHGLLVVLTPPDAVVQVKISRWWGSHRTRAALVGKVRPFDSSVVSACFLE